MTGKNTFLFDIGKKIGDFLLIRISGTGKASCYSVKKKTSKSRSSYCKLDSKKSF